jgi:iron-sulfur cluster repair protein YtfE (RIC family)
MSVVSVPPDDAAMLSELPNPEGESMVAEFEYVHGALRRELEGVRSLAQAVADGEDAEKVRAMVARLSSQSPIWTLRIYCLQYCRFVEGHHNLEDSLFFPLLEAADPDTMPSVVARLKSEHEVVAEHTTAVERAAAALTEEDAATRPPLVAALTGLSDHLLAHLDYEEGAIFATVSRMRDWRRVPGR